MRSFSLPRKHVDTLGPHFLDLKGKLSHAKSLSSERCTGSKTQILKVPGEAGTGKERGMMLHCGLGHMNRVKCGPRLRGGKVNLLSTGHGCWVWRRATLATEDRSPEQVMRVIVQVSRGSPTGTSRV